MTKAGSPPQSVGGKFGNITTISNQSGNNVNGINVNGNQNQIHVSGSGNVFGGNVTNITINHNGPAAAPEGGNKNKFKFGDFIKEVTKGAKDISDAGLKVLKENVDGAVRTASR
ncbi:hypothetical protein [Ktedonobacter sp. SOSP1-52]|uniref:hypothetical protein n=1 Tax=Ktedonobacter sp. SOSP1-52 TaxID=2778366 RepID=UPI001915B51D|nr:hypothetical protein [Ktedonobacter sp. SOSP1-52]